MGGGFFNSLDSKGKVISKICTILLVLGLFLVISGSYAYYKYQYTSSNSNKITASNTSLELLESSSNVINIPNAIPMSDEEGKEQSDVFDFVIKTNTNKSENISYSIVLEKLEVSSGTQELSDDEVKVYLTDFDGNELLLSNVSDISSDYVLYTKTNSHSSSNNEIKDKYKLRVWIDEKNTDIDFTQENNIAYSFKLGVKTNVKETDTEESYVVKYNSNGGTGSMTSTTFNQGESKKLSKNTFTKDGYTFKGWSTISSSKDIVYTDEEEVSNLTKVYNGVVNLYAVWVKENVTYEVRYNANGGYKMVPLEMNLTEETNHWTLDENGVYKSGNQGVSSSISSMKSVEFTLTEASSISFDWAVSSEGSYNYLYYALYKDGSTTALDGTGTSTKIEGNSSITDETDLTYTTVTKELEAGTYVLEFSYTKTNKWGIIIPLATTTTAPLDTGYVKNILIPGLGTLENSTHQTGTKSKLSKNEYTKKHYIFKGWSTTLNGNVRYNDEEEVIDLSDENTTVDLYAVWEKEQYDVNVVVQNGIINGESSKKVKYNENGIFNITPNEGNDVGVVTCTNGQEGIYQITKLIVKNVSNNTTCTVKLVEEATTLHEDGTLIINEQSSDASSNTTKHGAVTNLYEAMSTSNSYVFSSYSNQPWVNERSSIKSVEIGTVIQPISTAYWFYGLYYMETEDFTNLDTYSVEDMSNMFYEAGRYATTWNIGDLSKWNTSSVTNMEYMFYDAGLVVKTWNIGDISNWNTSSVTNMRSMFQESGYSATTFNLDLSGWDTSSVTDMSSMFSYAGRNATTFNLDLSGWNTPSVTDMDCMFSNAGQYATTFTLTGLKNWNTSSVTDMERMFSNAGQYAPTWSIGDLSNWNTSSVTNMRSMFNQADYSATTFSLTGLENWNTSSVTDMRGMFNQAGYSATTFSLDLSGWDTSKVYNMNSVFYQAGFSATTFNLDLSNWNTSSVTKMDDVIYEAGRSATSWTVKIPSTTVTSTETLTNTTSNWYGSSSSVYASPPSGRYFTLS